MRVAAERVSFDHMQHRIDNLYTQQRRNKLFALFELSKSNKESLKQLHCAQTGHSDLSDGLEALVDVSILTWLLRKQNNDAIVRHIREVLVE